MRPSRITMVWSGRPGAPVPSMTPTCVRNWGRPSARSKWEALQLLHEVSISARRTTTGLTQRDAHDRWMDREAAGMEWGRTALPSCRCKVQAQSNQPAARLTMLRASVHANERLRFRGHPYDFGAAIPAPVCAGAMVRPRMWFDLK